MKCRICGNESLKPFLSLGKTALANSFLSKEQLTQPEQKFPLETRFCPQCKLVQLEYVVPPEMLFKKYLYVTSTSNTFRTHFTQMAEAITKDFNLDENSLAVDIGSNDGLLLKGFQKADVKVVGVEPATNIAEIAVADGVETINDFFSRKVVEQIITSKGKADVVTANNVFAHIADIKGVLANVRALLKDDGIFVIEAAYFVDMLEQMTFDIIYHEHLFYYSLTPLNYFFTHNGMQIFKVQHVDSHGGSLRVFVKKQGSSRPIDSSVHEMLEREKAIGINDFETYQKFAFKVSATKDKLVKLLSEIKSQGKTIAAYGAPAKAATLLSFCGIGSDYIDYVVDDSPLKQGLFTPGTHIPVVSSEMLSTHKPDYILILAWNFADEIIKKTRPLVSAKFIIPLPEPVIV